MSLVDLGHLADFRSGGTPSRVESSYWDGGVVPWISGKDFTGFRVSDSQEHLTPTGANRATIAPKGATLILVRGMMLANKVPVMLAERDVAFNQDVRAIIPRPGIRAEFLAYAIQARAPILKSHVTYAGHGTGRLESDFIQALPIWVPPAAEQDAIVNILGCYDTAIAALKRQVDALRSRARALELQLLSGRRRLPGFEGQPWGSERLGEVFTNRQERGRDGLPTLSVTMNNGLVRRDTIDRKTSDGLTVKEHLLVRAGDIVYNTMRMWQGASGLATDSGLVSPAYVVLVPKPSIDPLFASYWLKSERMIRLFWAYSYGLTGDRLRLYYKDFSIIRARMPRAIDEQRAIAEVLDTAQREIDLLKELRRQIQTQKRGLMQKLLTGQIRVPPAQPEPVDRSTA